MNQTLTKEKSNEPLTLQLDISGRIEHLPGEATMAVNIYLPAQAHLQSALPCTLFTLVHGGTYTRRYWDLEVPGYEREEYSLAHYLARQGYIVLTLDNLGMGESHVTLDGFTLTTTMMAQAIGITTTMVKEKLNTGTLTETPIPVGYSVLVGHSMGAYLAAHAQATFPSFDAIVIQGHAGHTGELAGLDADTMQRISLPNANGYVTPPRESLHPFFHNSFAPPTEVIQEDDRHAVAISATLFTESLQRTDLLVGWMHQIEVPVLLTYGEQDVAAYPLEELAHYSASPSRSLYIHRGSAHCNNFAPTRVNLWRVLAQFASWARTLSTME